MHASFCVVCFHQDPDDGSARTVRLPSLVFFLPLLPPVLSFTLLLLHAASFFSQQHLALPFFLLSPPHASSLSLSFSLSPVLSPPCATVQPTLAHNETENLLLAPGECGRMITYIEQPRGPTSLPSSLSLSLSLRPSYRNGRLLCVVVHGEGGRREAIDRRFRRSTLAHFLDRVRCFGDMQTRKRGKSPSLSGKNFFQAIFRGSFFSKKSFEQRFSSLLSLLFFFLLQLLQFVWNDSIDALFQRKLDIIIFHFFSNQSQKKNGMKNENRIEEISILRSKDRISEGR